MVSLVQGPEAVMPVAVPTPASVEEHISMLKANAARRSSPADASKQQQHDSPMQQNNGGSSPGQEHANGAANGDSKGVYLPPPEVARTIPCRYFPNCSYGDKCLFFHPVPIPAAASAAAPAPAAGSPSSSPGADAAQPPPASDPSLPPPSGPGGSTAAASNSNGSGLQNGVNGSNGYPANDFESAAASSGAASAHQLVGGHPMYYYGQPGEANGAEYPAVVLGMNGEYLQYNPATGMYTPVQPQYYGYPQQQAAAGYASQPIHSPSSPSSSSLPAAAAYQYQQFPYPYPYPATHQQIMYPGMQGMTYSVPQAAPQQVHHHRQLSSSSPVNGVAKSTQDSANIINDPSIVSQSRTSAGHPGAQSNGTSSPAAPTMTKSSSASSSKKNEPASAAAQAPSPASPLSPAHAQALPLPNGQYVPYYPMAMGVPPEMQNAYAHMYSNQAEAARAQAQLDASFARASINGHQRTGSSPMDGQAQQGRHERNLSAQMHTFFQTSGNGGSASTYSPSTAAPIVTINGSGANGSARPPRSGENFSARGAGANGFAPGHGKRASLGGRGSFGGFPASRGPKHDGENSRSLLPCNFFRQGNCRYGDFCHFPHLLDEARALPGEEGKTTRDARVFRQNIANAQGEISSTAPRPTRGDFPEGRPPRGGYGANARNGTAQADKAAAGKESADVREKLDKLISETPRLNGAPLPAQTTARQAPAPAAAAPAAAARNGSIPASLGRRPFPSKQAPRVPSGENDFPALNGTPGSNGMERIPSASSTKESAATSDSTAAHNGTDDTSTTAASSLPSPKIAQQPQAASKPAFSWASAAAKAASLPDPPKRAASKARSPAPKAAETESSEPAPAAAPAAQTLASEAATSAPVKA